MLKHQFSNKPILEFQKIFSTKGDIRNEKREMNMYEKEEEKLELEGGKYRLSSIIGGNREKDQLYTTSQVSNI